MLWRLILRSPGEPSPAGQGAANPKPDPVAGQSDGSPPAIPSGSGDSDSDAEKSIKEHRRLNAQNKTLKEQLDSLNTKIKELEPLANEFIKIRESQLSETEKIRAENERIRKENEELQARISKESSEKNRVMLKTEVLQNGVNGDRIADFITSELQIALRADPDLDRAKWFEKLKTENPGFFTKNAPPSPPTGGGNQRSTGASDALVSEKIKAIEEEMNQLQRAGKLTLQKKAFLLAKKELALAGL